MGRFLPLILIVFLPSRGGAQVTTNILNTGDEVRVHAPSIRTSRIRGTVVLYQGSTLDLRERGTGAMVSIPVTDIRALARNEGVHRGASSWRMARFGGFVGAAGGLVAGPLIATADADGDVGATMAISGLAGTVGGAALGALVGAVFATDQWQRFRMPIVPSVSIAPGGVQLRFAASPQ